MLAPNDQNTQRPTLTGIAVGDEVTIEIIAKFVAPGTTFSGHVTKAAPVWITVRPDSWVAVPAGQGGGYRFRRDTQRDKHGHYQFATKAQYEFDQHAKQTETD